VHFYRIYNRILSSNHEFPELPVADPVEVAELRLTIAAEIPASIESTQRRQLGTGNTGDGVSSSTRVFETGGHYLVEYPSGFSFAINKAGNDIIASPNGALDPHMRGSILNNILGIALYLGGAMVLHGGAVRNGRGCIGFLGHSGVGKSTLVSWFLINGHALVTDDIIVPEICGNSVMLAPGYPGTRLWDDNLALFEEFSDKSLPGHSANRKHSVSFINHELVDFEKSPIPLEKLFILERGSPELVLQQISGHAALLALSHHTMGGRLIRELPNPGQRLATLARIAERSPVYTLAYPDGIEHLESIRQAVIDD